MGMFDRKFSNNFKYFFPFFLATFSPFIGSSADCFEIRQGEEGKAGEGREGEKGGRLSP